MSIVLVGSSSGSITLQEPAVAGTTTLNLPATSGTVVVTGTTPTLNGITFPATQVPSADANTLDDYEEGTWTPTAYGSSSAGTTTYNDRAGFYTKIGRQVTVSFYVSWASLTGTGDLRFGGLPFNVMNVSNINITGSLMTDQLNWSGGTSICLYTNQNSNFLVIYGSSDDGGWTIQQCVSEGASVIGTITYFSA